MSSAAQVRDMLGDDAANGSLPLGTYRLSNSLRALEEPPTSATGIALHDLAAELFAKQVSLGRRGVVICAPSRNSGASFTAANLSIALSKLGVSVLLVDANLREPAIDTLVTPAERPLGLADLISSDDLTLDQVIHHNTLPGFSILYAGAPTHDASELVATARCEGLLRECQRDFDFTVVDTPPTNRSVDATRLASIVGYAMIVARKDVTYVDDVATLSEELVGVGATVVGSLLNQA